MVTNKNEAQGNVTTNAKGNSIHGILNHCLFNGKCMIINLIFSFYAKNKAFDDF